MADKRIIDLTEEQAPASGDYLAVDNATSGTKKITVANLKNAGTTVLTQTLAAQATSVTFTNIPTTGNNLIDVYTDVAGLEYDSVDATTAGQLTYTFEAQESAVTVYLVIKEVS